MHVFVCFLTPHLTKLVLRLTNVIDGLALSFFLELGGFMRLFLNLFNVDFMYIKLLHNFNPEPNILCTISLTNLHLYSRYLSGLRWIIYHHHT